MHLAHDDWKKIESILARTDEMDVPEERLAFGKRILGDSPMRRSYFRGLVNTDGTETFAILWNAAIKNIADGTITKTYVLELARLTLRESDKRWLQGIGNLLEPEEVDGEPQPVAPVIPAPAAQPPAGHPVAPVQHAIAPVNYGINANQVHIEGGVHLGAGQSAVPPDAPNRQSHPPVRFTIRENSRISKGFRASLICEDPLEGQRNRQDKVESPVVVKVPDFLRKAQIETYFNNRSSLTDPAAHSTVELMKTIGKELFQACFGNNNFELYSYRRASRKLEFVIQGSPQFHAIPWELMRYVFENQQTSLPVVEESPIIRRVVTRTDYTRRRPDSDTPLRVLWVSARLPNDSIPRDAVLAPIRSRFLASNVIIDDVSSGSFLEMKLKLNEHREEPKYHVLHLDMHGEVTTPAVIRSAFGKDPNWILDAREAGLGNLPRDTDTTYETETTFVLFNQGSRAMPVSAHELSATLALSGIPLVVLNACDSAGVPSETASLVAHLVQSGGYPAVGFQQPVTVTGAILFFTSFYQSLIGAKHAMDFQRAVHEGRHALLNQSMRGAVSIEDWHLPALYTLPGISRV